MKKILLGTTALVAATMIAAPGAQASEKIKLGVGGFMWQMIGFSDQDEDYETAASRNFSEWDQKSASEVIFSGSTKLDNGITVGAVIELESDFANVGLDQTYGYVNSPTLGALELGATKGPARKWGHRAPTFGGVSFDAGDHRVDHWVAVPVGHSRIGQTALEENNDDNRVNYMSPRYMGFGLGLSFTPDTRATSATSMPERNTAAVAAEAAEGSKWVATLAYDDEIGGVKVGADYSFGRQSDGTATAAGASTPGWDGHNFGVQLGVAGFTLGGAYNIYNQSAQPRTHTTALQIYTNDGHVWNIGAGYAAGPYKISVAYGREETTGSNAANSVGNDESSYLVVGGSYNLGPGVDVKADIMRGDYDGEVAGAVNSNEGWGLVGGLYLSF